MPGTTTDFGFYPDDLDVSAGPVSIQSLPNRKQVVGNVLGSEGIERDWIYAPREEERDFVSGAIRERPFSARVFGLPKTHSIDHATARSSEQIDFHVWSLSFFTGMRLTATEAGLLDATPLKPSKLVDFLPMGNSLARSIELAEAFWVANALEPRRSQRFAAAVHALFLGQNPTNLQFESFIYLYAAIDACYALATGLHPPPQRIPHAERVSWMCDLFGIPEPSWAKPTIPTGAEIAVIRNDTLHEALFMDAPLGFALHGVGTSQNLTLEMQAFICRLLVALLGGDADYVQSPVTTRQRHGLALK